jgi:hypothetical protein
VLYGTHREAILNEQLLRGKKPPGCVLVSGPFSPGIEADDPLGYAVDPALAPRPFDPRLAATLIALAKREFAKEAEAQKEKKEPAKLELVLGHPASPAARLACQSMADQLTALGLPTKLHPLAGGKTRDENNQCDFVYTEISMAEPVAEARLLLGERGVLAWNDPYLKLALRRLDEAPNWNEARERLKALHRRVYADVTIIPLWQLTEHFVRRADFAGPQAGGLSLYERADAWRFTPAAKSAPVTNR